MIKKISLAADPRFDERCVQDALAANPGLLGFGDIEWRIALAGEPARCVSV